MTGVFVRSGGLWPDSVTAITGAVRIDEGTLAATGDVTWSGTSACVFEVTGGTAGAGVGWDLLEAAARSTLARAPGLSRQFRAKAVATRPDNAGPVVAHAAGGPLVPRSRRVQRP